MRVPATAFLDAGTFYINRNNNTETPVSRRAFRAHFHLEPTGCAELWHRLSHYIPENVEMNGVPLHRIQPSTHLLWVLHYAFVYRSEDVTSAFFDVTPKTLRKYVWAMFGFLARMGHGLVRIVLSVEYFDIYQEFSFTHLLQD